MERVGPHSLAGDDHVVVTEKLHGANMSFVYTIGGQEAICRRNGETDHTFFGVGPAFVDMYAALGRAVWRALSAEFPQARRVAVYGELLSPRTQSEIDYRLGAAGTAFDPGDREHPPQGPVFVPFDVWVEGIGLCGHRKFCELVRNYPHRLVPLYEGPFRGLCERSERLFERSAPRAFVTGLSPPDTHEGLVLRHDASGLRLKHLFAQPDFRPRRTPAATPRIPDAHLHSVYSTGEWDAPDASVGGFAMAVLFDYLEENPVPTALSTPEARALIKKLKKACGKQAHAFLGARKGLPAVGTVGNPV